MRAAMDFAEIISVDGVRLRHGVLLVLIFRGCLPTCRANLDRTTAHDHAFSETRKLPYSPEKMYDLVADVPSYPGLPAWVSAARERSRDESEELTVVEADLVISFKVFRERFGSRVRLWPKAADRDRIHRGAVQPHALGLAVRRGRGRRLRGAISSSISSFATGCSGRRRGCSSRMRCSASSGVRAAGGGALRLRHDPAGGKVRETLWERDVGPSTNRRIRL